MDTRRWLLVTVATAVAVMALFAGTNVALDIYGLFRDPAHRALPVFGNERVAKYLLSRRYLRANYDGVLIGSSVSSNWSVGTMRSARLYNDSVNGGNIVEEKALLDQVLQDGVPRLAVVVVHPFLTSSHESNSVTLTPREIWGALGSLNLIDAYKNALKIRLHRETQPFDPAGTEDFGDAPKKLNARLSAIMLGTSDFEIDPIAMQRFHEVVAELHARHVPLAFVVPPTEESLLAPKREAFRKYVSFLLAERSAEDRVLDFSGDEFAPFRADPSNFSDGVHLRVAGARMVTAALDDRMKTWIADGWLRQTTREVGPPRTAELIEKLLQLGTAAAHTVQVAARGQAPGR
jgi:hypothetical protein